MSPNKYQPHVLVLPEDDANHDLAIGFSLQVDLLRLRRIQVLPGAGGWNEVLKRFKLDHVTEMDRYPSRFMVLLIDFDGEGDRLQTAKAAIPGHLADRVFVLGVWSEPEALKKDLGSYEHIGKAMGEDCRKGTDTTWGHLLLRHNGGELERLRQHVRSILF